MIGLSSTSDIPAQALRPRQRSSAFSCLRVCALQKTESSRFRRGVSLSSLASVGRRLAQIAFNLQPRAEGLTVREVGALSDFDNISVRIADVATRLAVLGDRLRNELGSSAFPQFIAA